ncbi:hypothetical protein SAMN04487859_103115 [Roseovarius lutimaris]|uniref:NnrT protein n=1 Tax=Roseovarius lutimaris TaxID=1005928 RepID=A0A1I4ZD65_9RHOB|nr:hypothetical protein [Roseovarius lutimaris]SFN47929.1 hypothetical protein SAMN04487859_103115 [Roseovarius lutimaris]
MTETGPNLTKLYLLLYPFTALAVAINLFLLGLMWQAIGLPALSPVTALIACVPLGLPVNWWITKWVRSLIDEAEGRK